MRALAFDGAGRQLAIAAVPLAPVRHADGGAEQDMTETWQAAARAMRLLAQRLPDLARRAAALAITGHAGGLWLIDEDGDPVGPALLAPETGAAALVEAWRRSEVGRAVFEITGTALTAALPSAQLAWLQRRHPELLGAAASALHIKDWLYFCCTGERATDPAAAIAAFGSLRRGAYDPRVLELLGLEEAARLLPEIVDGTRWQGALLPAASVALGLWEGTPVVLAPPAAICAALAAGLHVAGEGCGCTVLGDAGVHLRWHDEGAQAARSPGQVGSTVSIAGGTGFCELVTDPRATPGLDWLAGQGERLLADLGLIGISGQDLAAVLEQAAAAAGPGSLLLLPSPDRPSRAGFMGVSDRTSLYDLMRAIYEGLGLAARAGYESLGVRPLEVRLAGDGARRPALREIVGACIGAPVRRLRRDDPAAAGAAWFAAVSLGQYGSLADGARSWVEPHLDEALMPDPVLGQVYERLFEAYRQNRAAPAAAPR